MGRWEGGVQGRKLGWGEGETITALARIYMPVSFRKSLPGVNILSENNFPHLIVALLFFSVGSIAVEHLG